MILKSYGDKMKQKLLKEIILISISILALTSLSYTQWPTSTVADSGLYICPGISSRVHVFDEDGSMIVSGTGASFIYLHKLDQYGNPSWPQSVLAHYNDSTDNFGGAGLISDGDGGVIIDWGDHRGAQAGHWGYDNEAIYIQRVDKNGIVKWAPGGILHSPVTTGKKTGHMVSDGVGGMIYGWVEDGFGYPGAPNRANVKIARYNGDGIKHWEKILDSNFQWRFDFQSFHRAGRYLYLQYANTNNGNFLYYTRIIDTNGNVGLDSIRYDFYANKVWKDSILFSINYPPGLNKITKYSSMGEIIWSKTFLTPGNCQSPSPYRNQTFITDERGGIYYARGCRDTILYFGEFDGQITKFIFSGIDSVGGYIFSDGYRGLVLANESGYAQRYDSLGSPLWGSLPIVYQSDPDNSYLEYYWSDKRGGIISTYWSTAGGIRAVHTGRYGRVGIVKVLDDYTKLPTSIRLLQNYPNPFNSQTNISFELERSTQVNLSVFDILGRHIATLFDGELIANRYTIGFDASGYASGVYYYKLQTESTMFIKSMIILK